MNVVVIRTAEGIIVGLDRSMLTANRPIGLGREQTSDKRISRASVLILCESLSGYLPISRETGKVRASTHFGRYRVYRDLGDYFRFANHPSTEVASVMAILRLLTGRGTLLPDKFFDGRRDNSLRLALMAAPLRAGQFFGEALAESQYPGVSLCLRSYRTGLFLSEHDHERAHFCFVLGGSYEERVRGRNHNRSRDDLIFYPPGSPHSERYLTGCRALLIDVKEVTWLHANEGGRLPRDPTDVRRMSGLGIARRICLEMQHNDDLTPLQIEALVMELLVECSRGRKETPCQTTKCVRRAEDFIRANGTGSLSLKSVAAAVQLHPSYLSRVFRKQQGMTVGQFIRQLRVREAQRLLAGSATPLAAIASECGFADQSHLFRVFRALVGVTPAEYRRQMRG